MFAVTTAHADIYMYVDEDGNYYFTDMPTSSKYRLFIKEQKPPSKRHVDTCIQEASRRYGIDSHLITAIMKVESDFNPRAVSKRGAKGLMQIMPENFEALNIQDPFNPRENIMGGTRYLRELLNRFNGEVELALAAYNAGPTPVSRINGIPPFRETEEYVKKVLNYYHRLKQNARQ
ncbi:MAG TPA: lytic transglycosylase [Deltaproteobacteria bacterium]|nr:lytic transglycosylase [Deltaproteobacteria bacterium]